MIKDFFRCKCGGDSFVKTNGKILCSSCGKEFDNSQHLAFFRSSDNERLQSIVNLGFKVGAEALKVGTEVLVGVVAPWSMPFLMTALGVVTDFGCETASEGIINCLFNSGTYGERVSKIFDAKLEDALKKGRKDQMPFLSFFNYFNYCSMHYAEIISELIDNGLEQDVFSEQVIRFIISDRFSYPGREDSQIIDNVVFVANDIKMKFENAVAEDEKIGLRWLVEKANSDQAERLNRVIRLLEGNYEEKVLSDDTYEYIKNYNRSLFLEQNMTITLGRMYISPIVANFTDKDFEAAMSEYKMINGAFCEEEPPNWYRKNVLMVIEEWLDRSFPMLLVYGMAGVGKTSLVTKIVADIYGVSGCESELQIERAELHTIILRNHIYEFRNEIELESYVPFNLLIRILQVSPADIEGHLIILDGLDEMSVLLPTFDADVFIKKLYQDLKNHSVKVLITSRPLQNIEVSYAEIPHISIMWTDTQIKEWCDKYSTFTDSNPEKEWCRSFKRTYTDLSGIESQGNQLKIFNTPLILYLACKARVSISANESIGKFYDKVFRIIANREHGRFQIASSAFTDAKKEQLVRVINWQYTKELAYQMFLNKTLVLSSTPIEIEGRNLIREAQKMTFSILRKRGYEIPEDMQLDTQLYLAVTFFAKGTDVGIEFAHKSAYEYFTAVKIYEDYFADFDSYYFEKENSLESQRKIWDCINEAFRYSEISEDVFSYFDEMVLPAFDEKNKGLCSDKFIELCCEGVKNHILSITTLPTATPEYKVDNYPLSRELCRVFSNLSWMLSGRGYKNIEHIFDLSEFVTRHTSRLNLFCWDFIGEDLSELHLSNAILNGAYLDKAQLEYAILNGALIMDASLRETVLYEAQLEGAYLSYSIMCNAKMNRANLKGAVLEGTVLSNAYLKESILIGAKFISADLREANLADAIVYLTDFECADLSGTDFRVRGITSANLRNARYCLDPYNRTLFPEGFNPTEQGMVEVDREGHLIN